MARYEDFEETALDERFPLIGRLSGMIGMPVSIIDTETTGLTPPVGIVEIAMMEIGGGDAPDAARMRQTLVKPDVEIEKGAIEVHGITPEQVADKPGVEALFDDLADLFQHHVVSGFNTVSFDVPKLALALKRVRDLPETPLPTAHLDVIEMWRGISGGLDGKLADVAERYGVALGRSHRADGDVLTTARILEAMILHHGLGPVSRFMRVRRDGHDVMVPNVPSPCLPVPIEVANGEKVLKQRILDRIAGGGALPPAAWAKFAREAHCSNFDLSQTLNRMLNSFEIAPEDVADVDQQAVIGKHLSDAIAEVGSDRKLKPLKKAIEKASGREVTYVQINAALVLRELGRPLRLDDPAPSSGQPAREEPAPEEAQPEKASSRDTEGDRRERARRAVLTRIERTGLGIGKGDHARILSETGCKGIDLSFAIGDLLREGAIGPEAVADQEDQDAIAPHIDRVMAQVSDSGRLKPIKERLDKALGRPVDYIQVRVALMLSENAKRQQANVQPDESAFDGLDDPDPEPEPAVAVDTPTEPRPEPEPADGDDSDSIPRW